MTTWGGRVIGMVGALMIVGGLTACGTPRTGISTPNSASPTSEAQAPAISHPITPGEALQNPCLVLTTAQLASLGFTVAASPKPQTDATGPQCSWQDAATYDHLGFIWLVHDAHGLTDLYARRADQAYFETTAVDGYPAVFAAPKDQRSAGACPINVGVSNTLMFTVQFVAVDNGHVPNACTTAKAAATDAIQTLLAAH